MIRRTGRDRKLGKAGQLAGTQPVSPWQAVQNTMPYMKTG